MYHKRMPVEPTDQTVVPCHVFTIEWIEALRRQQENLPPFRQSPFYRFVVSDDEKSRAIRVKVERWVDSLPPSKRPNVIRRFRSDKGQETYNEFAVGDSLRQFGHTTEYESDYDGLTPDWLIRAREGCFIVEVLTSNPSEDHAKYIEGWSRFTRHLESIPHSWAVGVDPPEATGGNRFVFAPDDHRQNQIVREVESWLEAAPSPGDLRVFDGIVFECVRKLSHTNHVCCMLSLSAFWVDGEPLTEAVKRKASKYKAIIEREQLPFVVSVVTAFSSGRNHEELERAVLGERLDNTGLFRRYPSLSAVTFFYQFGDKSNHWMKRNPNALFPLEDWAFPRQECQTFPLP